MPHSEFTSSTPVIERAPAVIDHTPTPVCLSCGDTMKSHTIPKLGRLPELLVFVCPSCKEIEVKKDKRAA